MLAGQRTQRNNTPGNNGDAGTDKPSPSTPAISLPKGGGAIRGIGEKFTANPVTGTGSLSVPIFTSPGRAGFGPQLSLSYDSGAGNGPFGFGWDLALPSIARKTDKGLPRYLDAVESDTFLLSGAEDLVPMLVEADGQWQRDVDVRTVDGTEYGIQRYRPRIEGLFARIERWTNRQSGETHWRSISRDNITTLYGSTAESRIADPTDPTRVFSWLICVSYDDKGHAMRYTYVSEDSAGVDTSQAHERNRTDESRAAQRYLKRITYGNQPPRLVEPDLSRMSWRFEVVFDYDEGHYEALPADAEGRQLVRAVTEKTRDWSVRQDPFSSYRAGFEVRTYRLCRRVLMFHHFADELGTDDYLVRSTELTYDQRPIASFMTGVTQSGYVRRSDGTYLKKSLPPLELEYSQAIIQDEIRDIDAESLDNLPYGLDGARYQWVDLDGEGLSGILTEQAEAWFYKPNLGDGRFGPLEVVPTKPSLAALNNGRQHLIDLAGDGQLDLVELDGPVPGFYERTHDRRWESFVPFASLPNIPWGDPNLRLVDLTGEGHTDVLIAEDQVFTWYPSLAEAGFGPAEKVRQALDEEKGPRLLFADGVQSIYLSDMSGDGLPDLVRVRNGEVCYWPNLGYGRFGAKVTMDDAPRFDAPDLFDQRRVRLADIDGSGVTDIIYLGRDGAHLYFNQSGNRWSDVRTLPHFPRIDNLAAVTVVDLLGNGTACLVWSSSLPGDARRPMRYLDLMGGQKPHLLVGVQNNLGAETRVHYAPSTMFYLADKAAGNPWITCLPFPVHVIERVETRDRISRNRFVTRYAYHHGYFDGIEREFRGFGRVEQWDTEEFAALTGDGTLPAATNIDAASHMPPVLTRSWFHTGVYLCRDHVSKVFAGEYYREPGLDEPQATALLLDDTVLPDGLSLEEEREACRALKGSMLRQEIYALDGTDKAQYPYTVTEQNFTIRRLQPRDGNCHGVFFTHAREAINYHYERNPADPRLSHALTLEVDDFGNVLKSAAIGYGRRQPDPALSAADQAKQTQMLITYTDNSFTNSVELEDAYRTPLPSEMRTYEITGLTPGNHTRFSLAEVLQAGTTATTLPYEATPDGTLQKRVIEHGRTLYREDDLAGSLPLGQLESRALPFESYKLAFTPGLITAVYGTRLTDAMLSDEGGYVHAAEGDISWWIPSGRIFYAPNPADTADQELGFAQQHFFLPHRFRDPFGHTTTVDYDSHDLLMTQIVDPLGNVVQAQNDYRVLQPQLITDPNGNRSEVAFDALGMVVGTAVMGKAGENKGDSLEGFEPDLDGATDLAHIEHPVVDPHAILQRATTRLVYDLFAYQRTRNDSQPQPAVVYTLARETHDADLAASEQTKIQYSFSYSDGFGREIQRKIQAEPGPVPKRDPATGEIIVVDGQPEMTPHDVSPRWVGSGWTIFNNKGKLVRQYEPFFTDIHRFEFDVRIGISPVLFYDPVERVVATLHPNHTWEKVAFDPWRQETWDVNDTVLQSDPEADPHVGDFFHRLPDSEYLPTWHAQRQSGALGPQEQDAARKAAIHADTPTVAHFDSLGRTFLTVAHNTFKHSDTPPADPPTEEFYHTCVLFDIEGNQREVIDAKDRVVMRYDYDMLGNRIHQASMEAGERWTLTDVTGKPLYAWDSRNHQFHTAYDQLRRPSESYLREGAAPVLLIERTIYGETQPNPEAGNLRGQVVQLFDQAGVVTSDDYDFKGNLLRSQRQLAREYKTTLDWSAPVLLEAPTYISRTRYDALNRPTELMAPDSSVIRLTYNDANLLEQVEANLRGTADSIPFVTDIDYDAKGQRTQIKYGSGGTADHHGVTTTYTYDPFTFRVVHLLTQRDAIAFPDDCPEPPLADWPGCQVQNLHYTYDPVGNITYIRDDAQQTIYFRNKRIEPSAEYTYDAIYRLIKATGREHLGQTDGQPNPPTAPDAFNGIHTRLDHPGDGKAMGRYVERYLYDAVGNILSLQHRGTDPAHPGWTRTYAYNETSQLEAGKVNNGLSSTTLGTTPETYRYDGSAGVHGNITAMPHLPLMQWDYRDQLQASAQQMVNNGSVPETTWYVYDASRQRVRKVTERQAAMGQTPTRMKERIYLSGFEIYREYKNDGDTIELERETLHITDDKQRIALVETRTQGIDPAPAQIIRYQFGNHLGSASLELDDQARLISYEEYTPYGSTSYQAVSSQIGTPKRYRYTGRERDEESGLYYHGARYYGQWLIRWLSTDPMGVVDGINLYQYVKGNPLRLIDPTGTQSQKWRRTEEGVWVTDDPFIVEAKPPGRKEEHSFTEIVTHFLENVAAVVTEHTEKSVEKTKEIAKKVNEYNKTVQDAAKAANKIAPTGTPPPKIPRWKLIIGNPWAVRSVQFLHLYSAGKEYLKGNYIRGTWTLAHLHPWIAGGDLAYNVGYYTGRAGDITAGWINPLRLGENFGRDFSSGITSSKDDYAPSDYLAWAIEAVQLAILPNLWRPEEDIDVEPIRPIEEGFLSKQLICYGPGNDCRVYHYARNPNTGNVEETHSEYGGTITTEEVYISPVRVLDEEVYISPVRVLDE